MENFLEQYTRFYYEQMYKNMQQSAPVAPTEIKQEYKPKKKLSNFSMASILEPEVKKEYEPVKTPSPVLPMVPPYWQLSAMYAQQASNLSQIASGATSGKNEHFRKGPDLKPKRVRTIFTQSQVDRLEIEFGKSQYMIGSDRVGLARELDLSETQVKVWFQNRRIKSRKQKKSLIDSAGEERSISGSSSDPDSEGEGALKIVEE